MSRIVGYAPGVYDLFHIGHLNLLRRAKERCDHLIAGVVADEVTLRTKGRLPVIPLVERLEIVRHISVVDQVHVEASTGKVEAWRALRFDRLFKGDDWRGTAKGRRLEAEVATVGVEVVFVPYTVHTSSTHLRRAIRARTAVGHG